MSRHLPYNRKLVERARELRRNETSAENKLWNECLRLLDIKVYRQRPIDNSTVDFYIPSLKLAIEVDGHSHFTKEGKARDAERTAVLGSHGLTVLRFTNTEVLKVLEEVTSTILSSAALQHADACQHA